MSPYNFTLNLRFFPHHLLSIQFTSKEKPHFEVKIPK
ncbi:hypothetical protein SAMN04488577_2380 [Bacillus sp. cl95]|nr:hypothetical protein SAMN02799634_102261 [Bacillus sp. UNCCL13]SFQ84395.1 hypothetical protein SAMN04488577_2380 [Bacillus sp. cl95]